MHNFLLLNAIKNIQTVTKLLTACFLKTHPKSALKNDFSKADQPVCDIVKEERHFEEPHDAKESKTNTTRAQWHGTF